MRNLALALFLAVLAMPRLVSATVTTTTRSVTYTCSGGTSYSVTYPFLDSSHLVVTKSNDDFVTYTTLAINTDYTVLRGATSGTVTTLAACSAPYKLRIARVVPLTQATSFSTQGTFSPRNHENAFDKLTMAIQQVSEDVLTSEETTLAIETHIASADDHTMYLKLTGRAGGQTAYGGTAASNSLTLSSTTNATKGAVNLGGMLVLNENASTASLDAPLSVLNTITAENNIYAQLGVYGWTDAGYDLTLSSTTNATKGNIYFGAASTYDEVNGRLGIKTLTPEEELHVVGDAMITGVIRGSSSAAGNLVLSSTSDATKGLIYATSGAHDLTYDQQNGRLGIDRSFAPSYPLDVNGSVRLDGTIYGNDTASGDMTLVSTSNATKGDVVFGAAAYAGVTDNTGAMWGMRKVIAAGATYTVSSPDDCKSYIYTSTDTAIVTLPATATANAGCEVTVANTATAAAALISVSPDVSDGIVGTCLGLDAVKGADGVAFAGTTNKDAQNTKATARKGDYITLVSKGSDHSWLITGCVGRWAEQP